MKLRAEGVSDAKRITCPECGHVTRGDTDEEVIEGAWEHMRTGHPELVETVTELEFAGWLEEV